MYKHACVSCRLIHCTWVYPLDHYPPFFGYYFFNVMLMVLQLLHIYWAFLISRMLYKFIFSTVCVSKRICAYRFDEVHAYLWFTASPTCILQLEGDDRSDEEEDDSDTPSDKKRSHRNGSGIRGRANGH